MFAIPTKTSSASTENSFRNAVQQLVDDQPMHGDLPPDLATAWKGFENEKIMELTKKIEELVTTHNDNMRASIRFVESTFATIESLLAAAFERGGNSIEIVGEYLWPDAKNPVQPTSEEWLSANIEIGLILPFLQRQLVSSGYSCKVAVSKMNYYLPNYARTSDPYVISGAQSLILSWK